MKSARNRAFTIVELLVVISVISVLMGVMLPCLGRARKQCRATICWNNIRQLYIANSGYSVENDGFYVRAARDMLFLDNGHPSNGGYHRWHGVRQSDGVDPNPVKSTFAPTKGPLNSYMADGQVKECPTNVEYAKEGMDAFEAGGGGYGYNSIGIGSRMYVTETIGINSDPMRSSMKVAEIKLPHKKVMFTDTAFIRNGNLIEYSFCEPPKMVVNFGNGPKETGPSRSSIHFRHLGGTNVVWCDGHVSREQLDFPESKKSVPERLRLGWFGPNDNSMFKPQ
jgi:prepilin-type processing-associated H-X9-DG protein/prepilin-type N-terminal cleavage/methylation domain-containing protein